MLLVLIRTLLIKYCTLFIPYIVVNTGTLYPKVVLRRARRIHSHTSSTLVIISQSLIKEIR